MRSLISPVVVFKLGILLSPISLWSGFNKLTGDYFPKRYLKKQGVLDVLSRGEANEIKIVHGDLARIHRLIRSRKPRVVLEFGVGFSTLVIAHALRQNKKGHLFTVDANQHWLENTRQKLGDLASLVTLHYSEAYACEHDFQLISRFRFLPNITPDFVYLDGPSTFDISGDVCGLKFDLKDNEYRQAVAADILTYESSLRVGAFILVDRRYTNVHFLKHNLKRKWKIHWDRVQHQVGFELMEITGRSFRRAHYAVKKK
jgi:SAM-dependent methyltransferase